MGKVLRRVWDLKAEILLFLEMEGNDKDYQIGHLQSISLNI